MRPHFHLAVVLAVPLLAGAAVTRRQTSAQKPSRAEIHIIQAWYGDPNGTGADVTAKVKDAFFRGDSIRVDPSTFTDTAVNHHKVLWLKYRLRGKEKTFTVPDEQTFYFTSLLDEAPSPNTYGLVSAMYHNVDVATQVRNMLARGVSSIPVDFSAYGISDPAVGTRKTLTLTFKLAGGDTKVLTGQDGDNISLRALFPVKEVPQLANGSFESVDTISFGTDFIYVPAAANALGQPGTFTISEGILRPFQLESSIRADFVEHTGRQGSMAMWIRPAKGRQPMLLWEEKVTVQPDTDYVFQCNAADISDAEALFATIVLEVGTARSKPYLIEDIFKWHEIRIHFHTGNSKSVHLKVWRDVLPYGADGGAALGLDDIQLIPVKGSSR